MVYPSKHPIQTIDTQTMIDQQAFLDIVRLTPLVSIDLLIRSADDGLLMGLRLNEPAAGYWFVPGGRILKDETIAEAFERISKGELGTAITLDQARLIGAFTHHYDTNFHKAKGIGTHYVVLAYEVATDIDIPKLPKDQHSQYRWVHADDDPNSVHENSHVYFSALGISPRKSS